MIRTNDRSPEGARWKIPGWNPFEAEEAERLKPYLDKIENLELLKQRFLALTGPPDTTPVDLVLRFAPDTTPANTIYVLKQWDKDGLFAVPYSLRYITKKENEAIAQVNLPDIGNFTDVLVTEILVKPEESIKHEQSLIVIECDKASMEIPSPKSGFVESILVKVGDRISMGDPIVTLGLFGTDATAEPPFGRVLVKGDSIGTFIGRDQLNDTRFLTAPYDCYLWELSIRDLQEVSYGSVVGKIKPFPKDSPLIALRHGIEAEIAAVFDKCERDASFFYKKQQAEADKKSEKTEEVTKVLRAELATLKKSTVSMTFAVATSAVCLILLLMVIALFLEWQTTAIVIPIISAGIFILALFARARRRR